MSAASSPQPPWAQQSFVLGNLAVGNLRENLRRRVAVDGRVHAESLLTAIGALTGFAAQNAALLRLEEATRAAEHVGMPAFGLARTKTGETYLVGSWINVLLLPEDPNTLSLLALLNGTALKAGLAEQDLPNWREIVEHVAGNLGTPAFDTVRVPDGHIPHLSPVKAVRTFWSLVTQILRLPAPNNMAAGEAPLSEEVWPAILGYVAAYLLIETKNVVDLRFSTRLIMEAAWIASRVHPDAVRPGLWCITANAGRLTARRNNV